MTRKRNPLYSHHNRSGMPESAALANFERARRCFEKAGLSTEWEKSVNQVRAEHRRKSGFMAGFEEIVAGSGRSEKPSFLERAKARWGGPRTEEQ